MLAYGLWASFLGLSREICSFQIPERFRHLRFLLFFCGTVSRNMLMLWPMARKICSFQMPERFRHLRFLLFFFFFCGTVSRNMLMLWPMGCGILPSFFQLSREICSCQMSETFRNICFLFFLGMSLMFWHMRFGVLGFIGLSRGIW